MEERIAGPMETIGEMDKWRQRTKQAEKEINRLSQLVDSLAAALSSHCGVPAAVLINIHSPDFKITPPSSSPSSGT